MNRLNQFSTQIDPAQVGVRKCVWMDAGVVDYKLCDRDYDCEHCSFDEAFCGERAGLLSRRESSDARACRLDRDLFYHPSHMWMRIEAGGETRVGLDDFGQRLLGAVYSVALPLWGTEIKHGESCCRAALQSGVATLLSPIAGRITETNLSLRLQPSLVNRDPYGSGWLMLIGPTDLEACLKQLLYGQKAKGWLAEEIEKLRLLINSFTNDEDNVPLTLNDGGFLTTEFLKGLSVEQTRRVISSFFSFSSIDEATHESAILVPNGR